MFPRYLPQPGQRQFLCEKKRPPTAKKKEMMTKGNTKARGGFDSNGGVPKSLSLRVPLYAMVTPMNGNKMTVSVHCRRRRRANSCLITDFSASVYCRW